MFRVVFPVGSDRPTPPPQSADGYVWVGHGQALLVDDEPAVLATASEMLRHLGYSVVTADGAESGLAKFPLAQGLFQLVVIDMTMPTLSGDEVLGRMRQVRPDLPAVLISGYSEEDVVPGNLLAERTVFVQKPFTLQVLRRQVRRVIEP